MSCFALLTENISSEIKPQCVWVCVCVFSLIYWLQVFKQNLSILKRIEVNKFSGHLFPCSPTILTISPLHLPSSLPVLFPFSSHSQSSFLCSHPFSICAPPHSPSVLPRSPVFTYRPLLFSHSPSFPCSPPVLPPFSSVLYIT